MTNRRRGQKLWPDLAALANVPHLVSVTSDLKTLSETVRFVTVTNILLIMRAIYRDTVREHMEKVMGIYSPPRVTDI